MIPPTANGQVALACLSAMQKCIRRGMEREAMAFACEIGHTSARFATMVTNRLQVISHEDIGIEDPTIIPLVWACCGQAKELYHKEKLGKWRLAVGSAIRAMCRCQVKSREGDHFQATIGLKVQLLGKAPEIPDWAEDMHTLKGKRMGRGLEHFREVGAKLVPPPKRRDKYEDECYEMWAVRDGDKAPFLEGGKEVQR